MRRMDRQDTPSEESIEDLLRSEDEDDEDFAHDNDSNDDVFRGAFNADDLLNCSLTSSGGLDLSTSNRGGLAGGHMSFSTSQGNLSTDECSFGVFDCDPPPPSSGTLIRVGVAVGNSSNDAEFSTPQLAEEPHRDGGSSSFNSGDSIATSSSHNSNNNNNSSSNRASPSARQPRSPDMTLEMVTRTGALALGSFHTSTSNSNKNMSQQLHQGSQRSQNQQQQHHYNNDDHSHRSHHSHQTTTSSQHNPQQQYQSPDRRRASPVRAFSSGFNDYGGGSRDNLNLQDDDNNMSNNRFQQFQQQQQQSPRRSIVLGESNPNGSKPMVFNNSINSNSSSNLSFGSNNNHGSNCMQQPSQRSMNSSSHRPSPTRSYSTNTHQIPGRNLDCAPLHDTSSSGNNNSNNTTGTNSSNNMLNGLNTNDSMTLEERKLRMQQFHDMQRMQQQGNHNGNSNCSRNMNNIQMQQTGNNNNNNSFPIIQNSNGSVKTMQSNNFAMMQNNMPFQAQNNSNNGNLVMQNNFTQMPNMQQMQMLSSNSFHSNGNNSGMLQQQQQVQASCGDTLLGTFPQGNAFAGMQCNVSIVGSSSQHCTPTKPQISSPIFDAQLSPVAAGLKAATPPSSMNEVMEKLSESMRRSAMSRSVVKQLSGRNLLARPPHHHHHQNPVMMMAQKQRGLMQRNSSERSLSMGGGAGADSSGRSIPVRRMSNSLNAKHHIQHPLNRSVHRHNSQQSLDAHSSHSITFQMDGRNMGTL